MLAGRAVDLSPLNRKYCLCKWGKDETLGVLKCSAKRAGSVFPNNFVGLSKDEATAMRDLIVLGYDETGAKTLFQKYKDGGFKTILRVWVGHHYPTNMTVLHKSDGKAPKVKIHTDEAHPDMLRMQQAQLGPIPACPYNSGVDHVTGGRRRGSSGAGRGSPAVGVDLTTGSHAAVGLGLLPPAPFEDEATVQAAAAAAAALDDDLLMDDGDDPTPGAAANDERRKRREQREAAEGERATAAAAAAAAAAPPGLDELQGRSELLQELGQAGLDDSGKHDVKSDTSRYQVEMRPPDLFLTSFVPMLQCARMAEEHAQGVGGGEGVRGGSGCGCSGKLMWRSRDMRTQGVAATMVAECSLGDQCANNFGRSGGYRNTWSSCDKNPDGEREVSAKDSTGAKRKMIDFEDNDLLAAALATSPDHLEAFTTVATTMGLGVPKVFDYQKQHVAPKVKVAAENDMQRVIHTQPGREYDPDTGALINPGHTITETDAAHDAVRDADKTMGMTVEANNDPARIIDHEVLTNKKGDGKAASRELLYVGRRNARFHAAKVNHVGDIIDNCSGAVAKMMRAVKLKHAMTVTERKKCCLVCLDIWHTMKQELKAVLKFLAVLQHTIVEIFDELETAAAAASKTLDNHFYSDIFELIIVEARRPFFKKFEAFEIMEKKMAEEAAAEDTAADAAARDTTAAEEDAPTIPILAPARSQRPRCCTMRWSSRLHR